MALTLFLSTGGSSGCRAGRQCGQQPPDQGHRGPRCKSGGTPTTTTKDAGGRPTAGVPRCAPYLYLTRVELCTGRPPSAPPPSLARRGLPRRGLNLRKRGPVLSPLPRHRPCSCSVQSEEAAEREFGPVSGGPAWAPASPWTPTRRRACDPHRGCQQLAVGCRSGGGPTSPAPPLASTSTSPSISSWCGLATLHRQEIARDSKRSQEIPRDPNRTAELNTGRVGLRGLCMAHLQVRETGQSSARSGGART